MNGNTTFRIVSGIVAALVMVAAIAGIAWFAYNAGAAQGSPITVNAPEGSSVPMPYYGYGIPFHRPFGFGCFGILFTVFFFILAMKAFRFMVWGPRFAHPMRGPWNSRWCGDGIPPMFVEWHKRAHGEVPAEEKKA